MAAQFEDTASWKKAQDLARQIYQITSAGQLGLDSTLLERIRQVTITLLVNVAKSFDANEDTNLKQTIQSTLEAISELKALLFLGKDTGLIADESFSQLYELTGEIRILVSEESKPLININKAGIQPNYESRISSYLK
jgi:four helix bundle protein